MPRPIRRALRLVQAYLCLRHVHQVLARGGFKEARRRILQPWRSGHRAVAPHDPLVSEIEWAVETACAWQWRRTVCLHRALTTYSLLRAAWARPVYVTGVMTRPFASHAWTELSGIPVADREMDEVRYYYRPILVLPEGTSGKEMGTSTVATSASGLTKTDPRSAST